MVAYASWVAGGKYHPAGVAQAVEWGKDRQPINLPMQWIPTGMTSEAGKLTPSFLNVGVYVDSLTILMFAMITLVSSLVHVFSIAYMAEDKRYPRFFTYLSLFCFSMLGLVLGGTILQLFIFWELVGLCSYLLIGFWYEKKSASNAAIKAFVVNRVGDFGFLIGFGILFYHFGNVTLPDVWGALHASKATEAGIRLADGTLFSAGLLTVMGIGLFFGAVGKSAQFPLHVWLPDAMEGPTPVSALIHAATMVAAGVYLVGRIFPILTPDARLFIAIIGCTTLTMAALIAIAQSDIKKVLAYSTLSQLGYMILAMGIGSWIGGLFHLITHAFFKALLFLGSGSVIHAAHHEQEMPQYGGLFKKIPVTAITFGIAVFAIAGLPYVTSGYFSKSMILTHAAAFGILGKEHSKYLMLLFWLPAIIAYITPFYMTRCWMLTFAGKPRNQHLHDHAHETPLLYIPLIALAIPALIAGKYLYVREMLESSMKESTALVAQPLPEAQRKTYNLFDQAWEAPRPGEVAPAAKHEETISAAHVMTHSEEALEHGEHTEHTYVGWAWLVGIGLGVAVYWRGYAIADKLMKVPPVRWVHTWLYRRMFFDELYMSVFVAITMGFSYLCGAFDKYIVDGLVNLAAYVVRRLSGLAGLNDKYMVDGAVNGAAALSHEIGSVVRNPSSGRIRVYVTALMLLVVLGVAAALVVALR
jgi:proton-translocating NADH-quinone oxidoreductase chain L